MWPRLNRQGKFYLVLPAVVVAGAAIAVGIVIKADAGRHNTPITYIIIPTVIAGAAAVIGLSGLAAAIRRAPQPTASRGNAALNQAVLNSLPAQVAVLDKAGNIIAVNEAWTRFADQSETARMLRAEAGKNYLDANRQITGEHARDARAITYGLEAILSHSQAEFTYEYALLTPRKQHWFLLSATPMSGEDGGAVVTHLDITERKRAERALMESQERFKRIAENAPDMIFRWSYAQGYEYVSPACTGVSGYRPEEYYTNPDLGQQITHPEDIPIFEETLSRLATSKGQSRYCGIRWYHKDGHIVHIEMRLAPILDEDGQLTALEGIVHDVSAHILAQERLRELTTRVTRAHEEERQRIARELHDEIGQALTITKIRLRMVENALSPEAEAAHDKLHTLDTLVEETLQNVRSLSHELRPPLLDEIGWEPALAWLCDSFSQRTGLPITYRHEGGSDRLDAEIELTAYRVVQEALTNIVRHADAQEAKIYASLSDQELKISIGDDGHGFDVSQLKRSENPHVGLGLLDMQERVSVAGGELQIRSAPGEGTTITVSLPKTRGQA